MKAKLIPPSGRATERLRVGDPVFIWIEAGDFRVQRRSTHPPAARRRREWYGFATTDAVTGQLVGTMTAMDFAMFPKLRELASANAREEIRLSPADPPSSEEASA